MRAALSLLLCLTSAGLCAAGPKGGTHDEHGEVECDAEELTSYNLQLAVGSIFILLGVSLVGCASPILLARWKRSGISVLIKVGSFCGSGVVLATALVHVLLPANEYLSNPCLPSGWQNYEAWAFMFCTAAIVAFQILDYYLDVLVKSYEEKQAVSMAGASANCGGGRNSTAHPASHPAEEAGACVKHASCEDLECGGRALLAAAGGTALDLPRLFSLALAELAIVLHSIIIGLALGVTPADEFNTLLVALCFHQMLEGFALGSAAVDAAVGATKAALLVAIYSLSTPVGIAVGIAIRQSFNSNAVATLLTQGILDAVCAGILIHVVLSGPMNVTKASRAWLRQQSAAVRLLCFAAFAGGAAAMSVIGKWA